jgi:hypothetical protein
VQAISEGTVTDNEKSFVEVGLKALSVLQTPLEKKVSNYQPNSNTPKSKSRNKSLPSVQIVTKSNFRPVDSSFSNKDNKQKLKYRPQV